MSNKWGELRIFACSSGRILAEQVCKEIEKINGHAIQLSQLNVTNFEDKERKWQITESVRGADAYVIGHTAAPKENVWEMRTIAENLKHASVERVTIVPTYVGENRRADKNESRVVLSPPKILIDFLKGYSNGNGDRVLLFELPTPATAGFFIPELIVDHLPGYLAIRDHLLEVRTDSTIIIGAGANNFERAIEYAKKIGAEAGVFHVEKNPNGLVEGDKVTKMIDVSGRDVILVADILDTGRTFVATARAAKLGGAKTVRVVATHALLSNEALVWLAATTLVDEVIVTNSVHADLPTELNKMKIHTCSIARLMAEAIYKLHMDKSISSLF